MPAKASIALLVTLLLLCGCSEPEAAPETASASVPQSGGGTVATPDVGAITPATGVTLDSAAGGGVNSAAMKKAKGIAAGGVGSVNNAQGGEDSGDGG